MTIAVRSYDFALTALGGRRMDVRGEFFKLTSSLGAIEVAIDDGGFIPVRPGQGFRPAGGFSALTIRDTSGAANAGELTIGDGDYIDDRVTGDVSVIDGGRSRTLAEVTFLGISTCFAVAGQLGTVQLFNPAGSGKRVIIEAFWPGQGVAALLNIGPNSTALTTLGGNGITKKTPSSSVSAGELRSEARATIPTGFAYAMQLYIAASTSGKVELREPVVIEPGWGFCVQSTVVNQDLRTVFEWYEEAV